MSNSRLIWIYVVCKSQLLSPVAVNDLIINLIRDRLYNIYSENISILFGAYKLLFAYAAILVVPKDRLRKVCGYLLPTVENCHNSMESLFCLRVIANVSVN